MHLATFNQQVLFAILPVRKALGHFQPAGAFCKSACQRGTWPLPTSRCFLQICMSEKHLATFNQQVLFANLPVRKAVGHIRPAGAFCKSACQKGSWPLSTSRCFLQICMWEVHIGSWPLSTSKWILHSNEAKCCLATFNQHYHFACKNTLGHFHPSKHFAILSMARKAKSPVTVCGNSRNVTFGSLERQNRKWPLSATDPGYSLLSPPALSLNLRRLSVRAVAEISMRWKCAPLLICHLNCTVDVRVHENGRYLELSFP